MKIFVISKTVRILMFDMIFTMRFPEYHFLVSKL